jgi:hypothetical protein
MLDVLIRAVVTIGQDTYNVKFCTSIVNGHISPSPFVLASPKKLSHDILEREPPLQEDTLLTILGKYRVCNLQC